ncbi:hypothetical protein PR202_gb17771 [Eleusine coracana subsp. coracana]|uniref:DUF569 domain-containing protein n=1 Tax=Eleusine coracana subsp. coracana TaxID=191504 RepID=A0AAV5F3S3_ELECO|nr:hypothetical protein PR202_gb17771 [Eleusine coracana subsp. coracana]
MHNVPCCASGLRFLLKHVSSNRFLGANGKYCRWRNYARASSSRPRAQEASGAETVFSAARRPWRRSPDGWEVMDFHGRSVSSLRSLLAKKLSEGIEDDIKLCVQAGDMGQMIPLLTDLPRGEHDMDIIVLSTSAPSKKLCSFLCALLSTCYLLLFG